MKVHVGTVGWSYKDWRGAFYPRGTPAGEWLAFYARRFGAVEVDSTFHAVPRASTVDHWAEITPPDFRFCLKAPGAITHERMLEGCEEDLLAFMDLAGRLGPRLGVVLLQLPPRFRRSRLDHLYRLLEALPVSPGLSVEFRHRSCFSSEMFEVLRNRGVGLVTTDAHEGLLLSGPDVFLRLMGERGDLTVFDRVAIDRDEDLDAWAQRVTALPDWVRHAWIFVNNLYSGHAPATAAALGARLGLMDPPEPPARQAGLFDS